MRVFASVLAFGMAWAASAAYAQAPAGAQTPATPPAPAAPAAQAALKPRFEEGLKYAYVNVQVVAAQSSEGKAAAEKIKSLQDQKTRELQEKNKALQTNQQKLEQSGGVLNDQARSQLQAEIDRQQRDLQRFSEDAQQDIQALAEQVEADFNRKLTPVIDKVARQKQVHFVFNAAQSGLIWAEPGMDLTAEVIQAFDAPASASEPAATPPKQ